MPDSRETARLKKQGKTLPQAPQRKPDGPGSPLGHVGRVDGRTVTLSDSAVSQMPGKRRHVVLGSRNG